MMKKLLSNEMVLDMLIQLGAIALAVGWQFCWQCYWLMSSRLNSFDGWERLIMDSRIDDPIYDKAKLVAQNMPYLCVAKLQRTLMIGYNRASRLMEAMIEDGLVEHTTLVLAAWAIVLLPRLNNKKGNLCGL